MTEFEGTGGGFKISGRTSRYQGLGNGSRSGGAGAPGLETMGSRSTGERRPEAMIKPRTSSHAFRRIPPKVLQWRRVCLKACLTELDRIASLDDDRMGKSNCLADIQKHLQSLWEAVENDTESKAFEEMVNILQIAFWDDDPAVLGALQLETLRLVISKLHDDPDVDDSLANALTEQLIRGGIDVFREIA
jgi:hypothetical protein